MNISKKTKNCYTLYDLLIKIIVSKKKKMKRN